MITQASLEKKLREAAHKHFCANRECRAIYQCLGPVFLKNQGGCSAPLQNERCAHCRGIGPAGGLTTPRLQPCCAHNVRQITDRDELLAYGLAGPGPWFRCKTCWRPTGWPQGINEREKNHG